MSSNSGKFRNISESPVEKWNLPSVDSASSQVFRDENKPRPDPDSENTNIPTAEEIESWHQQAQEEGYQEGMKKAEQENTQLKQRLLSLINFFESPLQSLNEEVEQQLSLLAVTLAQQLVRREIRAEPGEIIGVIRESIQLLPANSRKIKISLHPEDAALVRKILQLDENEEEQSWKILENRMISRGGCEITSDKSVINATLENRLQSLAASVLGGERQEDDRNATASTD
jgi:flagellar assembly protein FliH